MRILYVTTISLTMNSFFKPHVKMLVDEGNQVDIACNYNDLALDNVYNELGCHAYQVDFSRSPLSPDNIKAFGQLKKIVENGNYDIVHCHTPNASVITRLVCRKFRKKNGLKVFYTAHGFHFYKGAPILNWLVFYPIEKLCAHFTDKLITINKEDYELAKSKFKAKEVHYIPGVGIDLSKFENVQIDRKAKRREIGVQEDAILLSSVGELIERKNHKIVLQALANMENKNIHYMIAGKGPLLPELQDFVKKSKIEKRVHFLGYRKDIAELYKASDLCCFPSVHEGLPVALMEAMVCGLPCVVSHIRGNTDLINESGGAIVSSHDVECWIKAIQSVLADNVKSMGRYNSERVKDFSITNVLPIMKSIYES